MLFGQQAQTSDQSSVVAIDRQAVIETPSSNKTFSHLARSEVLLRGVFIIKDLLCSLGEFSGVPGILSLISCIPLSLMEWMFPYDFFLTLDTGEAVFQLPLLLSLIIPDRLQLRPPNT